MKHTLKNWVAALLLVASMGMAPASGDHANYEKVDIDLRDQVSPQHGAQIFTNYCFSCYSASGICFSRLRDIDLTEDKIKGNLMLTTNKMGDVMLSTMNLKDMAKRLGAGPPDLTLIARSCGADYLYAYMRSFRRDPTYPNGWNNTVLDKVGMPHPLWEQQRIRAVELDTESQPVMVKDRHGNPTPKLYWESTDLYSRRLPNGKVIEKEHSDCTRDLVNFLVYMGEPTQLGRKRIGYMVVVFLLVVMLPLAYFLKERYWKDVHQSLLNGQKGKVEKPCLFLFQAAYENQLLAVGYNFSNVGIYFCKIIGYVGFLDWEHTIGYSYTIKFVYGHLRDGILQEFKEL